MRNRPGGAGAGRFAVRLKFGQAAASVAGPCGIARTGGPD